MRSTWLRFWVGLLAGAMLPPGSPAPLENLVRNGDFEEDGDGDGMADDWQFAGDQGVTVTWARDSGFSGRYSQKLTCTRFTALSPASHAMLCQMDTVRLEAGQWYRISFAAKQEGIRGRAVQVALSNTQNWTNCGLQASFRVGREWKTFEFAFQATQTLADHIRLQFWYTSTGTFWLDAVRLEPSPPVERRFTEVLPATTAVNLLPNSSFECGSSGWGSLADLPGWGGNLNQLVGEVDSQEARWGRSSLRIALTPETLPVHFFDYFALYRVPVKAPLLANRGWIAVEPGADYTLSAYLKADSEGLIGVLSARQAFRGSLRQEFPLATEWQRVAFTFQPQAEQIFVALGLDLGASQREAGTVWIDGVQLEKGSQATAYRSRAAVEVGLETDRPGFLFPYGGEPAMTAILSNADPVSHTVTLRLQTTDFDDTVVHENSLTVEVPPGPAVRVPLPAGVRRKGFYRLHLQADGAEVALTRPLRFAILDPYSAPDSRFGMNHAYPWPQMLDWSRQIGLCWFRDWSLKWHDVEPEKGRFDFTRTDEQIERVLERGLNVLPLLPFPSSLWSARAGPEVKTPERESEALERIAHFPRDLEEFATYVRTTVQHYRDRLHVWEILNEPIYTSYALPRGKGYQVEDYVRLLQVAYQAVKAADPTALVIGGIAGGPATYTREFIAAGGLRWVDALNLHIYPGLTAPEEYAEPLRQLREQMQAAGLERPIWFTEGAYYADDDKPFEPYRDWLEPLDSERQAAEWQVQFNTLLLAYGTEKIIYHSGTPGSLNDESLSGIFFEWAGAPRKMVSAQVAMAHLLPPTAVSRGRLEAPAGIQAYRFETEDRTVIVAWAEADSPPQEISLAGTPWRAVDLQGNEWESDRVTLTERPIYLVAPGTGRVPDPW
jgi:hypothetical protein